ncbi:hypothetical protein ACFLVO_02665 [Chloroflexota bacterium]
MANRRPTAPHLRIHHAILEEIITHDFTERRRKIVDLILRLSASNKFNQSGVKKW